VSALATGGIVFVCVFGGAMLGLALRSVLPDHHRSSDSKDVVKLGMGLLATMAALVLSLLISSAKSSYDSQSNEVTQMAANVVLLDRVLAHYGPESKDVRDLLRQAVAGLLAQMGPAASGAPQLKPSPSGLESVFEAIQALSPQNDAQRALRAEARQVTIDLGHTRSLLNAQSGRSIPVPFLVILVFWVTVIFASFGLFGTPNATVITALFVCALSVSGAIFLILELDQPFQGLITVSTAPLRGALATLGQ